MNNPLLCQNSLRKRNKRFSASPQNLSSSYKVLSVRLYFYFLYAQTSGLQLGFVQTNKSPGPIKSRGQMGPGSGGLLGVGLLRNTGRGRVARFGSFRPICAVQDDHVRVKKPGRYWAFLSF